MNFFKWLGRSGKIALSTAQAVGLSAVVGVGGIAAWQMLDAPSDNTAFNLGGQYNPGEIVYVAGASGGSYGANGEVQSSFLATPSKAIEMTEKMTIAQKRAEEYDDSVTVSAPAPSDPQAYQMGGTEGLGMGGNRANEEELKNNPMALAQQSLAGVSDAISRAQQQAQQQAAAGGANGQKQGGAPASLASASRDWGSSAATRGLGGGGGNAFNSSFVVQDSTKGGKGASNGSLEDAAQVMKNFQAQAAAAQEGARMRARSSFGSDMMDGNLDAWAGNARDSKEANELKFITKRSADAAKNKNRAANEGARAFLASTKISGGMSVVGESVTTGQGQGSKDFAAPTDVKLNSVGAWSEDFDITQEDRLKDRNAMLSWMWGAFGVAIAAMIAIPLVKNITVLGIPVGLILALIIAAAATAVCVVGFVKAQQYANKWGKDGMSVAIRVITPILTAGVWASFIWAGAFKELYTQVGEKLGLVGSKGAGASNSFTTYV